MNRYNRHPKKKYAEDGEEILPEQSAELPFLASKYLTALKPLGRAYQNEDEKRAAFLDLIRMKQNRYSDSQCADAFGVHVRTIANWRADPTYLEMEQDIQGDLKKNVLQLVYDVGPEAIQVLYELMKGAKSEFVKYKAAERFSYLILELSQEGDTLDTTRQEVLEFLTHIAQDKRRTVNKIEVNVNVGGQGDSSGGTQASVEGTLAEETVDDDPLTSENAQNRILEAPEEVAMESGFDFSVPLLPGGKLPPVEE